MPLHTLSKLGIYIDPELQAWFNTPKSPWEKISRSSKGKFEEFPQNYLESLGPSLEVLVVVVSAMWKPLKKLIRSIYPKWKFHEKTAET